VPFNLSFTHLMVVAVVALVVLGPERLPGVARTAGNLYREWQRIKGGLEVEVREAINEFTEPFKEPIQQAHDAVKGVVSEIQKGTTLAPPAAATATAVVATTMPLAAALPSLGRSSELFSPGPPVVDTGLPELAPPPNPDTISWFEPARSEA
jgi:sec-independent protein translocase protein TatB